MRSNPARIAITVGAIALIVVLFVVLNGGGDDGGDNQAATTTTQATTPSAGKTTPSKPEVPVIRVRDGKPVGGVQKLRYMTGERVRFRVVSDIADEIHVHGFDITRDVPAGGSVTFSFPADIEGVFEVELHGRQEEIARLTVRPG